MAFEMITIKQYWDMVANCKCVVCHKEATIHHCKGGSMIDWFGSIISPRGTRKNHWLVIPLCEYHHTGDEGIDSMPTREWESRFGMQVGYLMDMYRWLGVDIWDKEGIPNPTLTMKGINND